PMVVSVADTSSPARFDRVPDEGGDIGPAAALDLADAGRRRDVDLGEIVADDVDADKDEAARLQRRPDALADLAIAFGHLAGFGPAADMHVGAGLAFRRHAVDGAGGDAVDEDDALVALAHLRQIALHDIRLAK